MTEYHFPPVYRPQLPSIDKNSGFTFLVRTNDDVSQMTNSGIPLYQLIQWSKQFCSKEQSFVDVGAHIGSWSMCLAEHVSQVYSFEPGHASHLALCGGVALNGISNVHPQKVALGSTEMSGKSASLYVASADGSIASLSESIYERNEYNYGDESVMVCSLDSYDLQDVGFIKINLDDNVWEVLQGAVETIDRCTPFILFKLRASDKSVPQITQFMLEHKYKIIMIGGVPEFYIAERQL